MIVMPYIIIYYYHKIIQNEYISLYLYHMMTCLQWIIFDGDVDPEWVENLNSVLDNNKLLTLPNGERLAIPPNVSVSLPPPL